MYYLINKKKKVYFKSLVGSRVVTVTDKTDAAIFSTKEAAQLFVKYNFGPKEKSQFRIYIELDKVEPNWNVF